MKLFNRADLFRVAPLTLAINAGLAAVALVLAVMLSGCIAVGYSSGGGWFIWPGGLGLLLLVLLVLFLLRRRR